MHWKKYVLLFVLFGIAAAWIFIYLPKEKNHYVLWLAVLFWIVYYAWVYVDRWRK